MLTVILGTYKWVESLGLSLGFGLKKYEAWPKPMQSPQYGPGWALGLSPAQHITTLQQTASF